MISHLCTGKSLGIYSRCFALEQNGIRIILMKLKDTKELGPELKENLCLSACLGATRTSKSEVITYRNDRKRIWVIA